MDHGRDLGVIVAATVCLTLGNVAWDVLGPLWTAHALGVAPDEWAGLRSLRFTGTIIGTLLIGSAAGRWDARTIAAVALGAAGLALAGIMVVGRPALALAMPCFGAAVSAVFVALNSMVQQVPRAHQARANGIYRCVGAGVAVVAPLLAAGIAVAWGQFPALLAAAAVLAAGFPLLFRWPPASGGTQADGVRGTLIAACRRPRLLLFIGLESLVNLLLSGSVAFTALHLSVDLGMADGAVGTALAAGAASAFAATLLAGWAHAALGLRRLLPLTWGLMAAGGGLLAAAGSASSAVAACAVIGLGAGLGLAPTSLAVARLGGDGNAVRTFTLWKLAQALTAVLGMQACAVLASSLGMAGVLAWGAIAAGLPILLLAIMGRRILAGCD